MNGPFRKEGDKMLLVEGLTDAHVVAALLEKNTDTIPDHHFLIASTVPHVIGVMVDADQQCDKRWEAIAKALSTLGYAIPESSDPNGSILHTTREELPVVGIWIMPDNQTSGNFVTVFKVCKADTDVFYAVKYQMFLSVILRGRGLRDGCCLTQCCRLLCAANSAAGYCAPQI